MKKKKKIFKLYLKKKKNIYIYIYLLYNIDNGVCFNLKKKKIVYKYI